MMSLMKEQDIQISDKDGYGSKEKEIEHVLRMSREHRCAPVFTWTPTGKRKVGRLKTTWRRTVDKERAMVGWKSWEEAGYSSG